MGGINTISHDDGNHMGQRKFEGFNTGPAQRKTNSQKRPNTAKTRKVVTASLAFGQKKKYNNFVGAKMASTPSHRLKPGMQGIRSSIRLNNMGLIPQQSQMFTSFGMPNS